MGFLGGAAVLLIMLLASGREREKYDGSYGRASDRYSRMSDEELQREAKKIQMDRNSDTINRAAKAQAMQDEVKNRRN